MRCRCRICGAARCERSESGSDRQLAREDKLTVNELESRGSRRRAMIDLLESYEFYD